MFDLEEDKGLVGLTIVSTLIGIGSEEVEDEVDEEELGCFQSAGLTRVLVVIALANSLLAESLELVRCMLPSLGGNDDEDEDNDDEEVMGAESDEVGMTDCSKV